MRQNYGKLMLPARRSSGTFTIAAGETTDRVELGVYFYPKGQEPSSARSST